MHRSFTEVKDRLARVLYGLMRVFLPLPDAFHRAGFAVLGGLARAYYFVPGSHVRRTVRNFCQVTGRSDAWRIYSGMVRNLMTAGLTYVQLMKRGGAAVADRVAFDENASRVLDAVLAQYGSAILLVPHCAGSILSAAGFGKRYPSVLLMRESKAESRQRMMNQFMGKLGAELVFARASDPSLVARGILKALQQRKLVVGTTDLIRKTEDTLEVQAFGQTVNVAAWPARFASRRKVPLLAGYVHMEGEGIRILADEPILVDDFQSASQQWLRAFEGWFRQYPEDWVFMLDKRWARVMATAAREKSEIRSTKSE